MQKTYEDELQLLADKVEGIEEKSWEELVDELNTNSHPDTLRKSFSGGRYGGYNVYKYFQDKFENEYCAAEEIERLEELKKQVQKEKYKLSDQRREYNKKLREEARYENLLDTIECIMDDLPNLYFNQSMTHDVSTGDKEACLLLSDLHYGIKTDSAVAYYDMEVAKDRLATLCDKTIEQCEHNNVGTLRICLLGDLVAGAIHIANQVESEEDVMSQIIHVSELIAQFVNKCRQHIGKVKVYGVPGNHSRMTKHRSDSLVVENFERLIFEYVSLRTGAPVYTNGLEDYLIFSAGDKKVYLSHGDRDNINNVREHAINMTNEVPDYCYIAHVHHLEVKDTSGTEVIVNGSIIGTDSYASSLRCNAKPYQILHIFDNEDEQIIKLSLE